MTPSNTETKKSRTVSAVRKLTWLAVALFLIVYLIVPRGITVFWDFYFMLFAPIVLVDVAALVAFTYCRLKRHSVSPAYAVLCVAVLVGVGYVTCFELRLRW